MLDSRWKPGLSAAATLILSVAATASLAAAGQVERPSSARQAAGVSSVQTAIHRDAQETRREFQQVLSQYPPALGYVLRLDPTLLTNAQYLASYPQVATFVAQYPDIPRNPGYYLERYGVNTSYYSNQPADPKQESLRMWRDAMEFIGAFTVFAAGLFGLFAVTRYIVEYRRWHRISKVNAEVHNKILDRFGSNEELLAYIDSPAGRRFLEATPITPSGPAARPSAAPFGRILVSVQVGIVLVALSIGLMLVSGRAIEEVQPVITGLGMLVFCLGVGSVVSAGASWALSRKLGLLPDRTIAPPAQNL